MNICIYIYIYVCIYDSFPSTLLSTATGRTRLLRLTQEIPWETPPFLSIRKVSIPSQGQRGCGMIAQEMDGYPLVN